MSPILLALIAGLFTAFGALLTFFFKPTRVFMAVSMGFASGIMLTLALSGLLPEAIEINFFLGVLGFVMGALLMLLLDSLLPHIKFSFFEKGIIDKRRLKTAMLIAFGIALHNLPEGFAISAGFHHLPALGLVVALAIALHNIPEGIAISLPILSAGGSKKKAFLIAFLFGLSEPLGALIGVILLSFILGLIPLTLAFAAGVMVYLIIDELLPLAQHYRHPHGLSLGIIFGCLVAILLSQII